MRIRLKRIVTCNGAFPAAGLVALHEPAAAAEYSPPGAFIGGLVSTVDGGGGSVSYTPAGFFGGGALLSCPFGHRSRDRTPGRSGTTRGNTSACVGLAARAL